MAVMLVGMLAALSWTIYISSVLKHDEMIYRYVFQWGFTREEATENTNTGTHVIFWVTAVLSVATYLLWIR